jgi:PTH1 family peptidyl-tRNA hydrolase
MIRVGERGSAGTHNGMKSVVGVLGEEFIRIRMGVSPEKVWGDRADYVLGKMGRAEKEIAEQMTGEAADAVEMILTEGTSKAMSRYNRRVPPPQEILQ